MEANSLSLIAPGFIETSWNEAEVLGSAAWLWMHSKSHHNFPLHAMPVLLLPAIKRRQFVVAIDSGRPVFYLSWANLSEEAERRYLANSPLLMPEADWSCGDRMWILDWVAPFDHTQVMSRILRKQLFANRWARALHHRGDERGIQIRTYQGMAVFRKEAHEWFKNHPVAYPQLRPAGHVPKANFSSVEA
jgi:cytolysin-activating lysine-acyltransferase